MGRPRRREARTGPRQLKAFLRKNSITLREAAKALQLKHPTVLQWVHGRATPLPHLRKRLAIWTNGEVPESAWETASEAIDVVPFKANGTDE